MTTRIEMDLDQFSFEQAEFEMGQWHLSFDDRKSDIHLTLRLGRVPADESEEQENVEQLDWLIRRLQRDLDDTKTKVLKP